MYVYMYTHTQREIYFKYSLQDYGDWQVQNLMGRPANWRDESMLPFSLNAAWGRIPSCSEVNLCTIFSTD